MDDYYKQHAFVELVLLSLQGDATAEQMAKLDHILKTEPGMIRTYVELMQMYTDMSPSGSVAISPKEVDDVTAYDSLLHALAEDQKTAPTIEIPEETMPRELIQNVVYPPREKTVFTMFHKFTLAACAAAILFVAYLYYAPQKPSSLAVATVVDQLNVEWFQSDVSLANGDRLWTNEASKDLKKGIVSILFDNEVEVLIEGPASFEIDRSGIYLQYGRLYSCVPESGLGFRVETPTAQFIDMGTEFGVQAAVNGSSELHVVKGKVQLFAGQKQTARISQMVTKNNGVRYDADKEALTSIPVKKNAFVRKIDSETDFAWRGQKNCNLADVVGGGNGFGTGQINWGINYQGQGLKLTQYIPLIAPESLLVPVPANAFVDCVFIPNGSTPINAGGELLHDFQPTSHCYYLGILNGAQHQDLQQFHSLRLNGIEYGTREHPSIYMHANQGITFDLEAIRQYTGLKIETFTAVCGLSETFPECKEDNSVGNPRPKASFFVLVDGREVFSRQDKTCYDAASEISIALDPQARFLTLATTQGSDDHYGDWTLFGQPALILNK